jgi:hypothetical protein
MIHHMSSISSCTACRPATIDSVSILVARKAQDAARQEGAAALELLKQAADLTRTARPAHNGNINILA